VNELIAAKARTDEGLAQFFDLSNVVEAEMEASIVRGPLPWNEEWREHLQITLVFVVRTSPNLET
jgi:hypothetical protein